MYFNSFNQCYLFISSENRKPVIYWSTGLKELTTYFAKRISRSNCFRGIRNGSRAFLNLFFFYFFGISLKTLNEKTQKSSC